MLRLTLTLRLTTIVVAFHVGTVAAQSEAPAISAPAAKLTPSELRDKQLDVSLETRDVERSLTKLKKASDLAKTRITEAATMTESAAEALVKGGAKDARGSAQQAKDMFKEIIKQLEALLTEETPQQLVAAREMAKQLARLEKEFADQLLMPMEVAANGEGKPAPKKPPMPGSGGMEGTQTATKKNEAKTKEEGKRGPGGNAKQKQENQPDDSGTQMSELKNKNAGLAESKRAIGLGYRPDGLGKEQAEDPESTNGGQAKPDSKSKERPGAGGAMERGKVQAKADQKGDADQKSDAKTGPGKGNEKEIDNAGAAGKEQSRKGAGGSQGKDDKENRNRAGGGASSPNQLEAEEAYRTALVGRAEKLEKVGETLKDVLEAVMKSDDPSDKDVSAHLLSMIRETNLLNAIDGMKAATEMIRSGNNGDARLAALDLADRLEIVAGRLDEAYREMTTPQAEQLRKLEEKIAELRERLDELETPAQVAGWHREIQKVLEEAEKLGVSERTRDDLLEQIKSVGWNGVTTERKWELLSDRYQAPVEYQRPLRNFQEEVQARIQNLLLGDILSATDEATPPKYQELVDRYYKVLSSEASGGSKTPDVRSRKGKADSPGK